MPWIAICVLLGGGLVLTCAVGCGKRDAPASMQRRPGTKPSWDAPTTANGFNPVEPKLAKCPPQGYPIETASGYYPSEAATAAH